MKNIKQLTKLNILVAVFAVVALVLPTIITFCIIKKNDAADEKLNQLAQSSAQQTVVASEIDNGPMSSMAVIDPKAESEKLEKTSEVVPELTTRESKPLTINATETDAAQVIEKTETQDKKTETKETNTETNTVVAGASSTDANENASETVALNGKKVYLTFDDGPSENTDAILDILAEYNVKATFFVVVNDDSHADQLNRIVEEGHTLGLHSACHVYSKIYKNLFSFEKDVTTVHNTVKRITGVDSKYYRFPGGSSNVVSDVSKQACIDFLHDNGYEYFDWNAESCDAENLSLTPEELNENVMSSVRNNEGSSVVLMHDLDDHYNTVSALPALIETLQSEGYEICAIGDDSPTFQHYIPE